MRELVGRRRHTDGAENRSITDGTVWTEENEVVWEVGGSDAEVGFCSPGPDILKISSIGSDDGEAWFETGVKPSSADQDVDGILVPIVAQATTLSDLVDLAIDNLNVRLAERFKVSNARRQSSTSHRPIRDKLLLQEFVVQLFFHLFFHIAVSIGVGFRILEEDSELAV